jgi:hypothetical protein
MKTKQQIFNEIQQKPREAFAILMDNDFEKAKVYFGVGKICRFCGQGFEWKESFDGETTEHHINCIECGVEYIDSDEFEKEGTTSQLYEFHLQRMAISPNHIEYLREFLKGEE